jgi:hypothetical protein
MYDITLFAHSWLRWAAILAGLLAIGRAILGASRRGEWTRADERAGMWFVALLDLQLLIGLVLYVALSPITRAAIQDFGAAMKSSGLRFWAVEHLFGMIVGLALVHVGRVRTRKLTKSSARHRVALISYTLGLLAILLSIPWPGMPNGRPLIRY